MSQTSAHRVFSSFSSFWNWIDEIMVFWPVIILHIGGYLANVHYSTFDSRWLDAAIYYCTPVNLSKDNLRLICTQNILSPHRRFNFGKDVRYCIHWNTLDSYGRTIYHWSIVAYISSYLSSIIPLWWWILCVFELITLTIPCNYDLCDCPWGPLCFDPKSHIWKYGFVPNILLRTGV